MAVNCLDYPVQGDNSSWEEEAKAVNEASPTFGSQLLYPDAYCQGWGHTSNRKREKITAPGAAPILVVGTTGDPATPYAWSEALADQLESGQLMTWKGNGHTAYGAPTTASRRPWTPTCSTGRCRPRDSPADHRQVSRPSRLSQAMRSARTTFTSSGADSSAGSGGPGGPGAAGLAGRSPHWLSSPAMDRPIQPARSSPVSPCESRNWTLA